MTKNTILDDAESRVTAVNTHAHSTQAQRIEAMREEIGRPAYTQAKEQLPKLEDAIQKTYRPFLNRVATIANKAKASLPTEVQGWLQEMATMCDGVPQTIRAGIEGWDRLTPPIWSDGQSLDLTVRAKLVHDIRFCLMNWDGVHSRLASLKGRAETYIKESGWPARQPSSPTIAPAPLRESGTGLAVETEFSL